MWLVLVIAEKVVDIDFIAVKGGKLYELVHMANATTEVGAGFSTASYR